MKQVVFCIASNRLETETIIISLRDAGFLNTDISVLMPDERGIVDKRHSKQSEILENMYTGKDTGFLIGGAFGWLTCVQARSIVGIGSFIGAGPIMEVFDRTSISAVRRDIGKDIIFGGLVSLGMTEYEAKRYENKLREGNILICVHAANIDAIRCAEEIYKTVGVRDIKRTGQEIAKKT